MTAPDPAGGRGAWAEDLALRHLARAGLTLVARNYRCRRGEVDLVMREGETLVFVEVRQRRVGDYGDGAESVDWRKRHRLVATAAYYLHTHPPAARAPCRFDVVAVSGRSGAGDVRWIRDAFQT
jgi:putative endonuclease